jgi:hypothetical integral membrane protein (TIGR02206 family)
MRTWQKVFVIAGPVFILGLQALFTVLLATPSGIRIDHPLPGRSVPRNLPVTGTAWIRAGIERIEVSAEDPATGVTLTVPAERFAVKYRGIVAFFISSWRADVNFPADSTWQVSARAIGVDGSRVATAPRLVTVTSGAKLREFRAFSFLHFVPLVLLAAAWVVLPLAVRRANDPGVNTRVALALSLVLWIDEIVYQFYWFGIQAWSAPIHIMLQMCGISILLLPLMFYTLNERVRRFLFELMYFWGLGGAVQALFAPDIGFHGFPEFKYFAYFISHGAIILSVLFAAAAWRIQLTWRSFVRVVVVTNLAVAAAYGINLLFRYIPPYEIGNYFVIGYPPPQGSVVDLFATIFGPSPRYLIGLELMGVVVFGLIYLPYPIARMVRHRRAARGNGGS